MILQLRNELLPPLRTLRKLKQGKQMKLNPWFITGIIDAEGTFCTTIYKNKAYKTGWVVFCLCVA